LTTLPASGTATVARELASPSHRRAILAILFVGVLMGALDIAIVGPALPAIRAHFGVDARAAGQVLVAYVMASLIGAPLMAKLSDRLGRRTMYVADIALFAAGSLFVAGAPTFGLLLVGRAVQGLGAGGIFPVASAVIGDIYPVEKRGAALGLIGAVFGLAFLVGPLVGGLLLGSLGWRWLFLVNLPIAAVLAVLAWRMLPSALPARMRAFDFAGTIALALWLLALSRAILAVDVALPAAGLWTTEARLYVLASLILLPIFLVLEHRAADPILRVDLLRSRQIAIAAFLAFGTGISEASVVFVPQLLVTVFGVTESRASYMLLPIVFAMALGAPIAGRLLDRVGSRAVLVGGASLLCAGLAAIGWAGGSILRFYLVAACVGIGLSAMLGAPLRYIVLNSAPREDRAAAQGALSLTLNIGVLTGSALVGALVASGGGGLHGFGLAFRVIAGLALAMLLAATALKGRTEELASVSRA